MPTCIHDDHPVRLFTQCVSQATFFRMMALTSSCSDPCSQTAFRKDALESAHELAARIMKRFESSAGERENFIVARLPAPRETFVNRIELLRN